MLAMTPTFFTLSLHLLSLLFLYTYFLYFMPMTVTMPLRVTGLSRLHNWPKDLIFFPEDLTVGRAEISSQGKA